MTEILAFGVGFICWLVGALMTYRALRGHFACDRTSLVLAAVWLLTWPLIIGLGAFGFFDDDAEGF